ncbi:mitochondrial inner membrane protein OXA1-like [Bidens hawaiensis]|uniref:mitochondrial inner membrane protein OXA1-like n=1 Tax=Bidens hawaiensis TaxID=980011 RepID=UPI0040498458
MAYWRSLTTKARQFSQQRFTPSILLNTHEQEDRKTQYPDQIFTQYRAHSAFSNPLGFTGGVSGGLSFRDPRWAQFGHVPMTASGFLLARGISTDEANKVNYMYDMADVLADKTIEVVCTQAPAVSEVAVAAADSWIPVAALQYAIDGIHNFTGLNWWASIVITTLVIRTLTIPIMINQLKATSKLTILRPQLEEIKQEMQDRGMSPSAVAEGQEKMKRVFSEHGVSTFTPLKGLLIQGPLFVSFFLAIQNMVEKVPSFKTGGASWFLDLTTADPFYLLPCLTAFSFWITVELNMQEGLEGNPAANIMKNVSRGFAALTVPLTASFPKALFCYWITSNLFSLVYGYIIKKPSVKKMLNIPIIVPPPPSPNSGSQPAFSFFESLKKYAAAQAHKQHQESTNQSAGPLLLSSKKPTSEGQKSSNQRETRASVLSQRIKRLEKEVKGRKKNHKR